MELLADLSSNDSSSDSLSQSSSLISKDSLLDESSFDSSSTSDDANFVPLVLRLFEQLVRHSRYSETWRSVLQNVREQLLGYVAGSHENRGQHKSERIDCVSSDPFYHNLIHTIGLRRHRRYDLECVQWTVSVAQCRTVRIVMDSSERHLTLRSCSSARTAGIDCCRSASWSIRSLNDFADCLDAVYCSSLHLDSGHGSRGKFHGASRG